MNFSIPSPNSETLNIQKPLNKILDNIYNQIECIKNNKLFNSKNVNFELEFRLLNSYSNINFEEFININSCNYLEYLFKTNQSTKYRIIHNSQYKSNESSILNINEEVNNTNSEIYNGKEKTLITNNDSENFDSNLYEFIKNITDKEITNTLYNKIEYTKKLNIMNTYYFIFKISLNIEISLETDKIINFLNNKKNLNSYAGIKCKEWTILDNVEPILKKRRSFIIHNDVRLDITYFNEQSQLEIDFSNNIYHDRIDMIKIIHNMIKQFDPSIFITDYLFMLLPNFEFQKPITPSFDVLFNNAKKLIEDKFFISLKTDGIRKLLIIINNLMFSINENFKVEYIDEIRNNFHIIMDCEYVNGIFIPFDIIYNDTDLRKKKYFERINILNTLDFGLFGKSVFKKYIKLGNSFNDIQRFIYSEINDKIPNDGVIITNSTSSYNENLKVYKIKTKNTVDVEFNGKNFLAKDIKINKKLLQITLNEFKDICILYNKFKKEKNNKNYYYYYRKHVEIIDSVPYPKRMVKYYAVNVVKMPFIIEYDLDNNKFVKVRYDKMSSNSMNTFKSILLASYQKINIDIFNPKSNILMKKYHNIIKNNILKNFKGNLLDIGTGNGRDIHKWTHFNKIVCVEPDYKKIEILNERISKSFIKNRIKIIENKIQDVKLDEKFDIATCFFTLNDFVYSDIYDMLQNIKNNIHGKFIIIFFDNDIIKEDIESQSIVYKKCFSNLNNNIQCIIDKTSPIYMIGILRYLHNECENIMFVNINDSNIINRYECSVSSKKIINIFKEHNFKFLNEHYVDDFPFIDVNQKKYTSYLKIIEFTNL